MWQNRIKRFEGFWGCITQTRGEDWAPGTRSLRGALKEERSQKARAGNSHDIIFPQPSWRSILLHVHSHPIVRPPKSVLALLLPLLLIYSKYDGSILRFGPIPDALWFISACFPSVVAIPTTHTGTETLRRTRRALM